MPRTSKTIVKKGRGGKRKGSEELVRKGESIHPWGVFMGGLWWAQRKTKGKPKSTNDRNIRKKNGAGGLIHLWRLGGGGRKGVREGGPLCRATAGANRPSKRMEVGGGRIGKRGFGGWESQ